MDALFVPIANIAGASVDQIKLISCLLVAYPLGSVFIRIPASQPGVKHLFSIAVSFFLLVPVLHLYSGFLQLLGSVLATYVLAATCKGPNMPWIVFAVVMGHLTINHAIRAIYGLSYETTEITGPQMVLTMKLTTFAWNVYDGRRPAEDLDKWQLAKRITKMPSLLEFLGYSFYFPGMLVGPYVVYSDYQALIDETMFKVEGVEGKTKQGMAIPIGRKRVAYRRLIMGLLYLAVYVMFITKYNYSLSLAPWFSQLSFGKRVMYYQVGGVVERSKYYAVWTLTEGASILTGLGFNGFKASGEPRWNGAANVKPMEIEFPSNFKVLFDSWNMNTNIWLRECVYKRVTPKGRKPGNRSQMLTFATSAFWHGIAGGYYLTFLMGGFVTSAARLARKNFRPLVLPPSGSPMTLQKRVYDLGASLVSILLLNYIGPPFMLLGIKDSLSCWNQLGWYGHVVVFGALAFFYGGGQKALRSLHPDVPKLSREDSRASSLTPRSSGTSTPVESFALPPTLDQFVKPPVK
ncbi:MBOAT, membrane-bound O-acyltransferase family-domain-containing protein [Pterulicium gracile]|uniref:MBOAT, membrane-bound O-acyltransferase family-domain-containing protein n=1 Tax=Pterulicium gracile TaxID=1884261 RepID=A0A5C3Q7I7_9AGAR|nr:MBOAT, membrane-bound O-acyltransferase family-domain-containing protein [Pterula gracilis]